MTHVALLPVTSHGAWIGLGLVPVLLLAAGLGNRLYRWADEKEAGR